MMTTWPIPADTPDTYGATYGNEATCKTQAFFSQVGIGVPFYTLCLSVYYYLVIVKNSRPSLILERCMHFLCFSFAFGTAIAALALDILGYATVWCWIKVEHDLFLILISVAILVWSPLGHNCHRRCDYVDHIF